MAAGTLQGAHPPDPEHRRTRGCSSNKRSVEITSPSGPSDQKCPADELLTHLYGTPIRVANTPQGQLYMRSVL
jgi:hypothetical protein